MPNDILLDLPNKRGICLGEKVDEYKAESGRRVVYEISRKNPFGDTIGSMVQWVLNMITVSRETSLYSTMFPRDTNDKTLAVINDVNCQFCGEVDQIRILCGGDVDNTNPSLPRIDFGLWDVALISNQATQRIIADQIKTIERYKERMEKLTPVERENELLRVSNEEKTAMLLQSDTMIQEMSSEVNRMAGEMARLYSFFDIMKTVTPKDIAESQDAAERLTISSDMLQRANTLVKEKTELLEAQRRDEHSVNRDREELQMTAEQLRHKLAETARHGPERPRDRY